MCRDEVTPPLAAKERKVFQVSLGDWIWVILRRAVDVHRYLKASVLVIGINCWRSELDNMPAEAWACAERNSVCVCVQFGAAVGQHLSIIAAMNIFVRICFAHQNTFVQLSNIGV